MKLWKEYLLELKKEAKPEKITKGDIAKAGTGGYVSKQVLDHGLHRLFGLRGETHSTDSKTAKAIKKAGYYLDPKKGGNRITKVRKDIQDYSKEKIYVTGYNDKSVDKRLGILGPEITKKNQPQYKHQQRMWYRGIPVDFKGDRADLEKSWKFKNYLKGKDFHVVGSEDFYNKNFVPDPDDYSLMSDKKLKVSKSRLGATLRGIKKQGLKGLKSSPKTRPLIGAAVLAGGGYATKKLVDPLVKKLLNKYRNSREKPDVAYLKQLVKQGKKQQAEKYLMKKSKQR